MKDTEKYNLKFNNNKEDVVSMVLSLNDSDDFDIVRKGDNFKITYNGGYNGVYDYKVDMKLDGLAHNIHDKFFYWKFVLNSRFHSDDIEVDSLGWESEFLDFFIDDFIRTVGIIKESEDI